MQGPGLHLQQLNVNRVTLQTSPLPAVPVESWTRFLTLLPALLSSQSCGLFPLLAYAAMSVRPVLLGLYEKYFLPLQKLLLPSLQAFLVGLLPGLEEGSEIYERLVDIMSGVQAVCPGICSVD